MQSRLSLSWLPRLAPALLLVVVGSAAFAEPMFTGLGQLPGSTFGLAAAVSLDGYVAVGFAEDPDPVAAHSAFYWESGTLTTLWTNGRAIAVSDDGATVVGFEYSDSARMWSDGTVTVLPELRFANGVSADGSIIVGETPAREPALLNGGSLTLLGDLPGGLVKGVAWGVSNDGSVVVGWSNSDLSQEAFIWENGSMIGLGTLPGDSRSSANATSGDGSVVVGFSGNFEAFLWTEDDGMIGLGDLYGGAGNSNALSVSEDGSIAIGLSYMGADQKAFIWDDTNGMQDLQVVLEALGLDLTGWTLLRADGISSDNLTIVGQGINPAGELEAFIATTPEPNTALLVAIGLAGLAAKKRLEARRDWNRPAASLSG